MNLQYLVKQLRPFAQEAGQALWCSFYLVGSALEKDNPRDIDVYGRMDDADFETCFGVVEEWERQGNTGDWGTGRYSWSKVCTVLTHWGWGATGLNLDVQIHPASQFDKHITQKVLIGKPKQWKNRE